MLRNGRYLIAWGAVLGCLLAAPPGGRAQSVAASPDSDDEIGLFRKHHDTLESRLRELHGRVRPEIYEAEEKTGCLHTAGRVWTHADNTNYGPPGNVWYPLGLNQDP